MSGHSQCTQDNNGRIIYKLALITMLGVGLLRNRHLTLPSPLTACLPLPEERAPLPRLEGPRLYLPWMHQRLASKGNLPTPSPKLSGPRAYGRDQAAAAPVSAKISIWKASLQLGPLPPGAVVMTRSLGPVSDTSLHEVPPAKSQELGVGEDSGGPGRLEGSRRRMFRVSPAMGCGPER